MYDKFKARAEHIRQTLGFRNADVDTLEKILMEAIKNNSGLSTIAD